MPEFLLDEDPDLKQWVEPDADGITVRTRYKGTEDVLDSNARFRSETPETFREDGVGIHHVASIPVEVIHMMYRRLGRMPSAVELLQLAQSRDFNKLKTRDVKL